MPKQPFATLYVQRPVYRDRLEQYLQGAWDPDSPEAQDSVRRAQEAQRVARATHLGDLFEGAWDLTAWDRRALEFWVEDPAILTALGNVSIAAACRLAVLVARRVADNRRRS